MTLPAGLDRTALLVGEGVEAPDMNSNAYMACLYYADLREIQIDPRKSADPRCTAGFGSLVLSESEQSIARAAQAFERMQQASQADKDKCRAFVVAGDAYFAGIAVSEGAAQRPVVGVTPRRIDVIVNRAGKVALYLEMSRGRAASFGTDADYRRCAGLGSRSESIGSVRSDPNGDAVIASNRKRLRPVPAARKRVPGWAGGACPGSGPPGPGRPRT